MKTEQILKFSELREEIEDKLKEVIPQSIIKDNPDGFQLLDGLCYIAVRDYLPMYSGDYLIGGSNIPLICIIGNNTCLMHIFPLKMVITDLDSRFGVVNEN